jgi:glycosyltransferase involved in cell wall biosynthesis
MLIKNRLEISVIMAVYNDEQYIREAIGSILNQSYKEFELLIIDDKSTDKTIDIIKSFKDKRIRLLRNKSNKGPAYSRNYGLLKAKGKYIAVLDSDDIAYKNRLKIQKKYLDEHKDVCLVGGNGEIIDEKGNRISIESQILDYISIRWRLLFRNAINGGTVMFRRNIALSMGGYEESLLQAEDYFLWIKMAESYKTVNISNVLSKIRINIKSLTRSKPEILHRCTYYIIQRNINKLIGKKISIEEAAFLNTSINNKIESKISRKCFIIYRDCLKKFVNNYFITAEQRNKISYLVLNDLLILARQCENERFKAISISYNYCKKYSPSTILSIWFIIFNARIILPIGIRKYFQKIRKFK